MEYLDLHSHILGERGLFGDLADGVKGVGEKIEGAITDAGKESGGAVKKDKREEECAEGEHFDPVYIKCFPDAVAL